MHILTSHGIDLDAYLAYLATVREQLPPHVWDFASNPAHHQLDGSLTLHDSWLESVAISERGTGPRSATRDVVVAIRLLGPMHDLRHLLSYEGVRAYSLDADRIAAGHGDLLAQEVRVGQDGQTLVHEYCFASYTEPHRLVIESRNIVHETERVE